MNRSPLIVIRSSNPRSLAGFYRALGIDLTEEKHGSGPTHYACEMNDSVFEIYPLGKKSQPTTGARLAFDVGSLHDALARIHAIGDVAILESPHESSRGRTAVIADPEGHRIELRELPSPEPRQHPPKRP
ncbi:MAG: VOC family protein [Myxococcota bacterium]